MDPPICYAASFAGKALYNCWLPAGHPLKNTPDQSGDKVVTHPISPASWTVKMAEITFHLFDLS